MRIKGKSKEFIDIACYFCGNLFKKEGKEYKRRKKNHPECQFYCSKRCSENGLSIQKRQYKEITLNCLICGTEFLTSTKKHAAKTCSISCATRLGIKNTPQEHLDAKKEKLRISARNQIRIKREKGIPECHILKCKICNNDFESKIKTRKTCSKECFSALCSSNAKAHPNCGGETNYKRYQYKDITMDSSWEVELAKWMDENNIKWIRSRKICLFWKDETGGLRRYYPDFYLPDYNVYLDPKNKYLQEKDKFKLDNIRSQNIIVFSGYLDNIKQKVLEVVGLIK